MKKFLALLIAAMLLLSSVAALAADPTPGITTNAADTKTMKIPVTKTLYFKNVQGAEVYEPQITYTFQVAGASETDIAGATVTDAQGRTAQVKPGDIRAFDGKTTLSLVFDPDHARVNVSSTGARVTKKNFFTFDGSKITQNLGTETQPNNVVAPGIYRYIITDTTTADKAAVGIVENSTEKSLILDVYVNNEGEVVGSVIHDPDDDKNTPNDDTDDGFDPDDNTTPNSDKKEGFDDPSDGTDNFKDDTDPDDDANDPAVTPDDDPNGQKTFTAEYNVANLEGGDLYETYNMEVSKTVTGDLGDPTHPFQFNLALANRVSGAPYSFFDSTKSAAATLDYGDNDHDVYVAVKKAVDEITGTTLKHQEKFLLKGVALKINGNDALIATVTETNDLNDVYTVTAKVDGNDWEFDKAVSTAEVKDDNKKAAIAEKTETAVVAATLSGQTAATTVAYTNNLENVSLTGVVLRFAPYIAMLVAGAALIVILAAKRRKEDEEA